MTPIEILTAVRELLADEKRLTRHYLFGNLNTYAFAARDAAGADCPCADAVSWTLFGALYYVCGVDPKPVVPVPDWLGPTAKAISAAAYALDHRYDPARIRDRSIFQFSDAYTHAEILAIIDDAIELLQKGT